MQFDREVQTSGYFDPATWLVRFERVGGGWVVRDYLSLMVQIEGRSAEDQRVAFDLIDGLSQDDQRELTAFLADRTAREAHDG